jgi:hypothetical protein
LNRTEIETLTYKNIEMRAMVKKENKDFAGDISTCGRVRISPVPFLMDLPPPQEDALDSK